MVSKIGRVFPLVISGVVLVGFLINFKHYRLYFENHFEYGAGVLHSNWGEVAPAGLFAQIYLHLALFTLFISGILLFVRYKKISKVLLISTSVAMLIVFLLRPVISLINYFSEFGWPNVGNGQLETVAIPTVSGQLIGNFNEAGRYDLLRLFQGYLGGVVLLLLLVLNLVFSFVRKANPVNPAHGLVQPIQVQNVRATPMPMSMPVQQQGVSVSMTQELERLQQMYQSGSLSEEEFTVAKKRVLGN